jgi:hypothetical protein
MEVATMEGAMAEWSDGRFDEFAVRVDERFDRAEEKTDERFDRVDERFDRAEEKTDERFDRAEEKTVERFDQVDEKFVEVNRRLGHVDHEMGRVNDRLDDLVKAVIGGFAAMIVLIATQL